MRYKYIEKEDVDRIMETLQSSYTNQWKQIMLENFFIIIRSSNNFKNVRPLPSVVSENSVPKLTLSGIGRSTPLKQPIEKKLYTNDTKQIIMKTKWANLLCYNKYFDIVKLPYVTNFKKLTVWVFN